MNSLLGKTISRYRVTARVGAGGMGVVYRAFDSILDRDVALKVIREERAGDRQARARFLTECRAAAGISHPNIATVYDAGESEDGLLYFVSELVEGETLQALLARGRIAPALALDLGAQLAQALASAHARGILHRDIKPSNLMVTPEGRLKVLDFGLARLASSGAGEGRGEDTTVTAPLTQAHAILGTPAYMSPEQAVGLPVDLRTDIFSASAVIYEMLSGRPAFGVPDQAETLQRVLSVDPDPLETLEPSLPSELTSVLTRSLAKDRARRPASSRELAEALVAARALLEAGGVSPAEDRPRGARRGVLARVAAVAAVALIVAAALWHLFRARVSFVRRDALLVADVDNRTGDSVFDVALKSAIESDLQQSRYANIFEQARVTETLRLMRRDPTARVTEEVGRDICRFAGLKALIVPRILAAGDVYDLYVMLVDPVSGRSVDRARVTVRGRGTVLLRAVDQVTRKVRSLLGESLDSIHETDLPVAQVTTSSWDALRDLSMGQRRWGEGKFREAAALFQRALEEDPHFMAARGSLGLLLVQFLDEPERGRRLLREALAEADSVSRREQLLIRALCKQFVDGDSHGALEDYRLISESYPDLMQPYNNSGVILRSLGRLDDAIAMFESAARAAPQSFIPLSNLYWTQLSYQRQPAAAESVARRMVALDSLSASALVYLGWSFVAQHRLADAEREFRRALRVEPAHAIALPNLAHVLLESGRAREAVPLYRRLAQSSTLEAGNYGSTRVQLSLALCASGGRDNAVRVLEEAERSLMREGFTSAAKPAGLLDLAQIPAARDRAETAAAWTRRALRLGAGDPVVLFEASQVYALLGRSNEALEFLRRSLDAGYWDRYYPLIAPQFASIRMEPRFWEIYPECPARTGSQAAP